MAKIILLALSTAMLACILAKPTELYTDIYDKDFNIHALLNDEIQRRQYIQCFVGEIPCDTDVNRYFKDYIYEIHKTRCARCTDIQKQNFGILIDWYLKNAPTEWQEFIQKLEQQNQEKVAK